MTGDCNVCIGGYDVDGYYDFQRVEMPRARRVHRCCECRGLIQPGDQYEYLAGKFDGDFSTSKTCLSCADIRDKYTCKDGGATCIGDLWEEMREYVFPHMTTGCLDGLSPENKARVLAEWRKWKGVE